MKEKLFIALMFLLAMSFVSCDQGASATEDGTSTGEPSGGHHVHMGKRTTLDTKTIDGYKTTVTQIGDVEEGKEVVYETKIEGGKHKFSELTVRVWYGDSSGEAKDGKVKSDPNPNPDHRDFDAHVIVPEGFDKSSLVWIEIDTPSGKAKGSFKLK